MTEFDFVAGRGDGTQKTPKLVDLENSVPNSLQSVYKNAKMCSFFG
jgi:hypothetical protein